MLLLWENLSTFIGMDFIQQLQLWERGELLQGKIMIGIGILFLIGFIAIFRSQNEFLRGSLIPLGLFLLIFIGYGGYILYSRPAHVKDIVALYEQSKEEAITKEIEKHTSDNKVGKTLIKYVYPILIILSALGLLFISSPYYKGMLVGFMLLFLATYTIDSGFVSRSEAVLGFLTS